MGTAATKDTGVAVGNVMSVGAFGLGGVGSIVPDFNAPRVGGVYTNNNESQPELPIAANSMTLIHSQANATNASQICTRNSPSQAKIYFRVLGTGGAVWSPWGELYSTLNTTKASDGALKAASPVARIASPDASTRPDIDEDSFEWCGYGVANSEAYGIEITREDIGVYRVAGAKSLASSGWRLLPPRDPDGSGDLGVVTAEQVDDEIIISLFRRKMLLVDGEIVIQPGEPIDVPANSWIDVRLDMSELVILPDVPVEEPPLQPE